MRRVSASEVAIVSGTVGRRWHGVKSWMLVTYLHDSSPVVPFLCPFNQINNKAEHKSSGNSTHPMMHPATLYEYASWIISMKQLNNCFVYSSRKPSLCCLDYHYSRERSCLRHKSLVRPDEHNYERCVWWIPSQDIHLGSFSKPPDPRDWMCLLCLIREFGHNWWIYNCLINHTRERV